MSTGPQAVKKVPYEENLKELTGLTFYEAVEAMVDKLEERFGDLSDPSSNTEVLALARGGLIPATYAVYRLGCPINIFYLRSYTKPKVQKGVESYGMLPFRNSPNLPKRIIVIDDILDTGKSFEFVREYFTQNFDLAGSATQRPTELLFASVVHRIRPGINPPDVYGVQTASMGWVNFPYEPPHAPPGRD